MIDVHRLTDDSLKKYGTELWAVLSTIRYSEDKEKLRELVSGTPLFRNFDREATNVVCHYIRDSRLVKRLSAQEFITEDGGVNMCGAIDGIYEDGVTEGIERGIERGKEELILNAMKSGSTAEEIALALKIDLTYVLSLKEEMKK